MSCVEKLIQQTSHKVATPPLAPAQQENRGRKRKRTAESENTSPKKKRVRTVYSKEQLFRLETLFAENPYPDQLMRENIAEELGVTERKIHVWFQNRRAKQRKRGGHPATTLQPLPPCFIPSTPPLQQLQPLPSGVPLNRSPLQQLQPLPSGVPLNRSSTPPLQQLHPLPPRVTIQPLTQPTRVTPSPVQHDPSLPAYFPLRASSPPLQRISPHTVSTPSYVPTSCYRMHFPSSLEQQSEQQLIWHYSPPSSIQSSRCSSISPPLSQIKTTPPWFLSTHTQICHPIRTLLVYLIQQLSTVRMYMI